jgi:hypothetical protein
MAPLLQSGRSLERGVQNGSRVKRGGETAPVELFDGSHGTPHVEVGANYLGSHDTHPAAAHRLSRSSERPGVPVNKVISAKSHLCRPASDGRIDGKTSQRSGVLREPSPLLNGAG